MDASVTAPQAPDADHTLSADVSPTSGRGSGRGRGRTRSRGRGRGRGRGGGGDRGSAVEAQATAGFAGAMEWGAAAAAPAAVTTSPIEDDLSGGGGSTMPPKRERKRGADKKKKQKQKADVETTIGEKTTPPPRAVVERTPLETLIHAVRVDDLALFNETLAGHANLQLDTLTKQRDAVLVEACRYARLAMVQKLLLSKRVDVNVASLNDKAGRKQLRPIHAATMALRGDIVQELLDAPNQVVDLLAMYDTALPATIAVFFCVANGYTEEQQTKALAILDLILDRAKRQGDHVLQQILEMETSRGGNRLVHMAVLLANYEAVEILKRLGADVSVPNALGLSPLQLVENNAFHRRSFMLSRLPLRTDKSLAKKKQHSRKKKPKEETGDVAEDEGDEPESAAEIEVKVNHTVKRLDRELENTAVLKTLLPLIELFGLGPVFSRKGSEGIRSIHIKGLVLAHEGIPSVTNQIFALLKDDPKKLVYVDGILHCVTSLHGLSLKNNSQFAKLWKQAFLEPLATNEQPFGESTLAQILDSLLDHKSLSRRVKVWTMIVVKTLGCFDRDAPVSAHDTATLARLPLDIVGSQAAVYERIAEAIYRSGCKMLFSIFDRSEVDEDESYDEELEFHLLLALAELFFQLYIPFSRTHEENATATVKRFKEITAPIQRLWGLLETALASLDETVASPQRFSLVLHTLQVFEVVGHALERQDDDQAIALLFKTLKQFAKHELSKKRFVHDTLKQVQLLHNISELFPLPKSLLDRVVRIKDSLDLLLRSDAKILGLDLYAFARHDGIVRLEHKVEYLEVLSEEQSGSIHITISRASNANYVDFILQQVLSTSPSKLKGELDVGLIDEPGVGAGVVREFFQIIQHSFFNPQPLDMETVAAATSATKTEAPPAHVSEIGSQWLDLARNGPRHASGKKSKRGSLHASGDVLRFFPLFQHADDTGRRLRITPRNLRVSAALVEQMQKDKTLHLTQQELLVDEQEVTALKQLYLCAGRLLGLAIRDQQPLDAFFPLAFWKFMTFEKVPWQEYCEGNDVFQRSLQFVLDHDFDAEPLEMQFEFTADVLVVPAEENKDAPPTTVAMEVELAGGAPSGSVGVLTNANKATYVEFRAKQFFFGNEYEYYKKMRDGLGDTIRKFDLKLFLPSELQRVVRGDREIDVKGLKKSVIYSRGITEAHEVVRHFWEVVETFDAPMKEKLLTFWSGSALPPLFGFHSHNRTNPHSAFWYFDLEPASKSEQLCPTANTCDRRLMVPQYPTKEALREKLLIALEHGAVGYDRM